MDYSRNIPGTVIGGARSDFQQADMSAQKEALYRQSMNANANSAAMSAVPSRQSESLFHEIGGRFTHLGELISRLEMLTDRACGCVPCDPKVNAMGRDAPSTLIEKIGIMNPMLVEANSRLMGAIQRLESFV